MNISIRQVHPLFVGEVSGLDISRKLSTEQVAAIEAGMDRHAVLVFPGQRLTMTSSSCSAATSANWR
jgi:alpha-ketoglutarate-dependent 2,4-dichlorophenoxyacetate dioxygenase